MAGKISFEYMALSRWLSVPTVYNDVRYIGIDSALELCYAMHMLLQLTGSHTSRPTPVISACVDKAEPC